VAGAGGCKRRVGGAAGLRVERIFRAPSPEEAARLAQALLRVLGFGSPQAPERPCPPAPAEGTRSALPPPNIPSRGPRRGAP